MAGTVRNLNPQVVFNGGVLEDVMSFRWSLGYDKAVGEASIVCVSQSGNGSYYDDVSIIVDGSTRWSGVLTQWDYNIYPRSVTMQCRGRLQFAADYKLPDAFSKEEKGLQLADLTGGPATDQNIVGAVLSTVGLSTNGGSIGGTGTVLGTIGPETFVWAATDSALAYIQKIDQISLGYRTFESAGGQIFRTQITTVPAGASFTLEEGVDIIEGSTNRTVIDRSTMVRVGGYSVGDYLDPRVFVAGSDTSKVYTFNSEMIERRANSSPGSGFSCEAEANYWLGELNREIIKVTLKTPRADVFGPGQTHNIQATDRGGVGDTLWVQSCDGELRQDGSFTQSLTYIGGG